MNALDFDRARVYLPSTGTEGAKQRECLKNYVHREFPEDDGDDMVYSVPRTFAAVNEKQASHAELVIFQRLTNVVAVSGTKGLWVLFFHGTCYGDHFNRNQQIGKLMIREHDFVVFAKYKGKCHVILAEVKSTHDARTIRPGVNVVSDAKAVKNNKRSAQHQLRDHLESFSNVLGPQAPDLVERFIMWPFLSALTRDPKQAVNVRWREDGNLHVFEDSLSNQADFNEWFNENVLGVNGIEEKYFEALLNRFIILSCGVFVDEIHKGMLALLNQQQLEVLTSKNRFKGKNKQGPLVIHGAAGTGKTLLVLKKIQKLYEQGELDEENRVLYICYWPGIRCDFENKLKVLGLDQYVDSARFYISQTGFLLRNKSKYRHIFMDEAEAICLAFEETIMMKTLASIYQRYHNGNCKIPNCKNTKGHQTSDECMEIFKNHETGSWGQLWFLVDINQASLFLPKHSPDILKTPAFVLDRVMRSTGYIFKVFQQFYSNPMPRVPQKILTTMKLHEINIGHNINGPPILWVDTNSFQSDYSYNCSKTLHTLTSVIIDLCTTKGVKPNTLCVIPFLVNNELVPDSINKEITSHFAENAYRPRAVGDVEDFVTKSEPNDFLIAWALRVKGLEFKVVIIVIEDEDFDINDAEDRKKIYIMASRCTCLLIMVCPKHIKDVIDKNRVIQNYSFSLKL